jgi:hypothetical protein
MVPQPGGPVAGPGETCRNAESRSTIVIREPGRPEKPVYQLIINFDYCYRAGAVTVTSRTSPPSDDRVTAISPTSTSSSSAFGGPRYLDVQQVFFTGCAIRRTSPAAGTTATPCRSASPATAP